MNVTLSPAGVCWVEFADGASAARAALRDGEVSAGHSLRVTLLHPQPVAQPPQLLGRAPPAEWYGHVQEGNSLVADLAALRVRRVSVGQEKPYGRQTTSCSASNGHTHAHTASCFPPLTHDTQLTHDTHTRWATHCLAKAES